MTINEFLKTNKLNACNVEICIYDEKGYAPYDDDNFKKYLNAPCLKICPNDEMYSIDCYFSKEICYPRVDD